MEKYEVMITARITKIVVVEFDEKDIPEGSTAEDYATEIGHENFNPEYDESQESYNQETISVLKID